MNFCIRCAHASLRVGARDSSLSCVKGDKAVSWGGSCPEYTPFEKFGLFPSLAGAACLPARSAEGARTDSQPAHAAAQQIEGKNAAFDFGFSDLRRCSTADQSRLRDFEDSSDGH